MEQWQRVAIFSSVYVLLGMVVAIVVRRVGRGAHGPMYADFSLAALGAMLGGVALDHMGLTGGGGLSPSNGAMAIIGALVFVVPLRLFRDISREYR